MEKGYKVYCHNEIKEVILTKQIIREANSISMGNAFTKKLISL
jgi:hypothetical protein